MSPILRPIRLLPMLIVRTRLWFSSLACGTNPFRAPAATPTATATPTPTVSYLD
jgi:hypothetical protein